MVHASIAWQALCVVVLAATASAQTATPTSSRTPIPTASATASPSPTQASPPPTVHIDVDEATGRPGDAVDVDVLLTAYGASVAATANDITIDKRFLGLDPSDCRINPAIGKALVASVFREQRSTKTLRIFIQTAGDAAPIPDGVLYTCSVHILPTTAPRTYALTNRTLSAFAPDGSKFAHVTGASGAAIVVLVLVPSATPTVPPTSTPSKTPTATLTPDRNCPRDITLAPNAAMAGDTIQLSGFCYFVHSGRSANVLFDDGVVATVRGDTVGNYTGSFTVPAAAAPGSHTVRVVAFREIASATFEVTGPPQPCVADCDGNGKVTVDEVLTAVSIALGGTSRSVCPSADADMSTIVTVDEVLAAVSGALSTCLPGASPTAVVSSRPALRKSGR